MKRNILLLFALATLALCQSKGQTQVGDSQLKAPPTTFTAVKVNTTSGWVWAQPDGLTFQIDTSNPALVLMKCIVPAGGGGPAVTFVDGETPVGLVNGTNRVFTLANAPVPAASLVLYRNGIKQRVGSDFDLAGATITFRAGLAVPLTGDPLEASYRR